MRGKFGLMILMAVLCPAGSQARGLSAVIEGLKGAECVKMSATYSIALPQAVDDVVYTVNLMGEANSSDTLAAADYLIEWSVPTPSGKSEGFSAYFDGHHYRYRDQRLQEYHLEWDSIPFKSRMVGSTLSGGVQQQAQFASLIPQFIGAELEQMSRNPQYTITVTENKTTGGRKCTEVRADLDIQGYRCSEQTYLIDDETGMPLALEANFNPGALSEQSVTVKWGALVTTGCEPLSEEMLIARYPETFEKFRQSNFRIENLTGSMLPAFALATTTGERYSRRAGDAFRCPTIVVLLESRSEFTPDIIKAMRSAVDRMPGDADVIYAFADNRIDDIDAVLPSAREGEHLLMNARSLARDCGASSLPVTIICSADGRVANVMLGYNNNMASDVIQMTTLAN